MKNRKTLTLLIVFLVFSLKSYGQTAQWLEDFLKPQYASFGNAVAIVLASKGGLGYLDDVDRAMEIIQTRNYAKRLGRNLDPQRAISYGQLALILMKEYGIKGSLFYSIFGSPRYAALSLSYKGWHTAAPRKFMKPRDVLLLLRNAKSNEK